MKNTLCSICGNTLPPKKKFLCSNVCFKLYRRHYGRNLMRRIKQYKTIRVKDEVINISSSGTGKIDINRLIDNNYQYIEYGRTYYNAG